MRTYHPLTEYQRYQMYALKKAGHIHQHIARLLGVSPSTISREIWRNRGLRGYRPPQAHQHALKRRRSKAKATQMTAAVIGQIEAYLQQQWSPEQRAGRLAFASGLSLSVERIYQHIRTDRQVGGTLYHPLRPSQKKHRKRDGKTDARGQIKDRVSIEQPPAIVDTKQRLGDWAIDLVVGAQHNGALVSLVQRRSRYTLLGNVRSKQAAEVAAKTIELLAPDTTVYFAHPYQAWQRRLNENTKGLIRQYGPKGTALDTLSETQVHHIIERLNHRPRKGLAFQTPHEILCNETGSQPKHCNIALTSGIRETIQDRKDFFIEYTGGSSSRSSQFAESLLSP